MKQITIFAILAMFLFTQVAEAKGSHAHKVKSTKPKVEHVHKVRVHKAK